MVLYTPEHDATFWTIGVDGARAVIDLWAEGTEALFEQPDVEFVLVFENGGTEVGATIPHPHGQIYAYDHVPSRPRRRLEAAWKPGPDRLTLRSAAVQRYIAAAELAAEEYFNPVDPADVAEHLRALA